MSDLTVPVTIIPWEEITLGAKLGEGGFGIVYKGTWKHGGEVAIKQIKGTLGEDAEQEFKAEAGTMAQLNSPYIIRLFGICWEHDKYAMVMELMPNASLYHLLHTKQDLPWNLRYNIAKDIAYGLRLLHARKTLHRDLKSLNVLLDRDLRAKLTDFGLAKVKTQSKTTSKAAGGSVGTIAWMAPELFNSGFKSKYSEASDVYAYGMTTWELASRATPYQEVADPILIKDGVTKGEREEIPADCPQTFAGLIQSCWDHVPSKRPTMDMVVRTLEQIIAKEPGAPAPAASAPQATPIKPQSPAYQGISLSSQDMVVTQVPVKPQVPTPPQVLTPQYKAAQVQQSAPPASGPQQHAPVATPQINPAHLQAFLNLVVAGQQDEAEAMLKQNPALALASGTVTDHAKRTFRNITGFQYAVWALDWHMWRMIKKYIPLEEARLQAEGFAKGSWVPEHEEHVTWKRLIDSYKTLIDKWDPWTDEQINTYWVQEIGGAQLILPMHVLQEYCQPDRTFDPVPNFRDEIVLVRKLPDWLADLSKIGKDFSIYRGDECGVRGMEWVVGPAWLPCAEEFLSKDALAWWPRKTHDRTALIHLNDTRLQQRGELVAELRSGVKFPINPAELQAFLNLVVAGQQDEAEVMLKENPALALASGTVTDHAQRTFRNITGFQYAVWALDWHMWRMIKKYLPHKEARLQAEGFATGSWVKEYGEHVTWKRLIDNYQILKDNCDQWTIEQINKYWVKEIGGAQLILPMHVLQEFCQPDRPFHPAPNFSEEIVLIRKLPDWLSDLSNLGKEFSIYRTICGAFCGGMGGPQRSKSTEFAMITVTHRCNAVSGARDIYRCDRTAIIQLSATRLQQRGELIAELRSVMKLPKP